MSLPEFLLARLDEIDPLRGRLSDDLPHHPYCGGMTVDDDDDYEFRPDLCDCGWPARVLAECAAKRAIVELHRTQNVPVLEVRGEVVMSGPQCRTCADWDAEDMDGPPNAPAPCATLRLLARPYADHPAFDLAWRV